MKKFLLLAFIVITIDCIAQPFGTYYVAAKTGLSMRENPDANAKVLEKIPYATKVTTIDDGGDWKEIETEGMTGYWRKVKFNNKTGYIVDNYLLPWAPPKLTTVKELKQYFAQLSLVAGAVVTTRSNSSEYSENGWKLSKQLYKNGAEYHEFQAYEYGSSTYFLPNFTFQQGFLLCRLVEEFKDVFGEKDEFPLIDKTFKKGEYEHVIKVIRPMIDGGDSGDTSPFSIQKIAITFEEGAYYEFEMYRVNNQLVIFFGSGV